MVLAGGDASGDGGRGPNGNVDPHEVVKEKRDRQRLGEHFSWTIGVKEAH